MLKFELRFEFKYLGYFWVALCTLGALEEMGRIWLCFRGIGKVQILFLLLLAASIWTPVPAFERSKRFALAFERQTQHSNARLSFSHFQPFSLKYSSVAQSMLGSFLLHWETSSSLSISIDQEQGYLRSSREFH